MNNTAATRTDSLHTGAELSGRFLALDTKIFSVTLVSSTLPIGLEKLPPAAVYGEYPLYLTRSNEDGQTRYRLRLGTFSDSRSAESLAQGLRLDFPTALVSELLDSERENSFAVRPWPGNSKLKRKAENPSIPRQKRDSTAPVQKTAARRLQQPRKPRNIAESRTVKKAIKAPARKKTPPARDPQAADPAPNAAVDHEQACAFAVNLKWSPEPVRRESLPNIPALHQRYLYFYKKLEGNLVLYGLRAGFFPDRGTAGRFAASVRDHFPSPELVPVHQKEFCASANAGLPRRSRGTAPRTESAGQQRVANVRPAPSPAPVKPASSKAKLNDRRPVVDTRRADNRASSAPRKAEPAKPPLVPCAPKRVEPAAASEEYRVISPFALLSYLLVAVALLLGWQLREEQYIVPEFGLGYALGITGSVMMLLLLLYPLRKKARFMRNAIPIKYWYQTHIVLGIIGPVLVVFHSNFSLGSTNSRVALFSTLVIAGSGFIGKYFYAKIHHGLSGQKATLQELQREAEAIRADNASIALLPKLQKRLLAIEERVLDSSDGLLHSIVRPFSLALRTRWAELRLTGIARRELRRSVSSSIAGAQSREELQRNIHSHIVERLQKVRRVAEFSLYEQLFSWWHVLHFPLFLILIVAAVVHVIAVHMY